MTRKEKTREKAIELLQKYGEESMCNLSEFEVATALSLEIGEWCDKTMIEKACKYLYRYNQQQTKKHGARKELGITDFTINVEEFRKVMLND